MSLHPPPSEALAAPSLPTYQVNWLLTLPYPVRNMLRRWRGMLGMMVGVGIALGLGMTMLAVSKASIDLFTKDYLVSGADLYVVTEGGSLIALLPGDSPGTIEHARRTLSSIRGVPGVREALGFLSWSLERDTGGVHRGDQPAELLLTVGIDGDPTAVPDAVVMQAGRWMRRSNEVVIGATVAREKHLGVGDDLRLAGRDFTIAGIGRVRGAGFSSDSVVYMEYGALRQRADIGDVVNFVAVDAAQPDLAAERIRELGSLSLFDRADLVRLAEEANAAGVAVRLIFNLLTLGIAALFVSNMLGRSVAERRLEFATLRAIGIPTRTIFLAVGGEALLVTLVAGVFGVALSLFMGFLINATLAPAYGLESLYSVDAGLFGIIFATALALGVLAGYFPARNATRADPVDILREA